MRLPWKGMRCDTNRKPAPPPKTTADRIPPVWDEGTRTLTYKAHLLLKLKRNATNQIAICRAFQACAWRLRIVSPLTVIDGLVDKQRLHDAMKLLNRRQHCIHFGGDGTGAGVTWKPTGKPKKNALRP